MLICDRCGKEITEKVNDHYSCKNKDICKKCADSWNIISQKFTKNKDKEFDILFENFVKEYK